MDVYSLILVAGAGLATLAILALGFVRPLNSWPVWLQWYAEVCTFVALVVLPVVTIVRALRRPPDGTSRRVAFEVDLAEANGIETFVGDASLSWLLRLPGNESLRLELVAAEVVLPRLPPAADGLSILQFSDLHFNRSYRRSYFDAMATLLERENADLVVFTGDLIDDPATLEWIAPVFNRLRGRLGQFAILGNHDFAHDPPTILKHLAESGFKDIEGLWVSIPIAGGVLALGGTSSPWGPRLDLAGAPVGAGLRIVLSHSPDQFPRLARNGVDLVLSGHNHGGQVRFPIIGPVLMPSRYGRRFDRGFFRLKDSVLYVNQGVGGRHPIRYGCAPEVTRITLRSEVGLA